MPDEVRRRRRFPPPWDLEEHNRSCFIVRDNNGQALAYVYFETEPGRQTAANPLTRDEARRIAANIVKLPELAEAARSINLAPSHALTVTGNGLQLKLAVHRRLRRPAWGVRGAKGNTEKALVCSRRFSRRRGH